MNLGIINDHEIILSPNLENGTHLPLRIVSHYFKKTEKFADVQVKGLVQENGYYDPLFVVIGKKGETPIVE